MNHNLEPLDVLDQRAERVMQACRIGCHDMAAANDLLAECYGVIGALLHVIEQAPMEIARAMPATDSAPDR